MVFGWRTWSPFLAMGAILYFGFTELHYDVTHSLSAAFYAEHLGGFPENLVGTWDHRGYAHKLVAYLCYQTAAVAFEPSSYWFERAFKFIYALLFGSLIFGAAYAARDRLSRLRVGWFGAACGLSACCFAVSGWCACQPEHSAAMIAVAATLFLLGKGRVTLVASALLASTCFFFKAVTISFSLQPLLLARMAGEPCQPGRLRGFSVLTSCLVILLVAVMALTARSELEVLYYAQGEVSTFARPWFERLKNAILGLPFCWMQAAVFPLVVFLIIQRPPRRGELIKALPVFVVAASPLLIQGQSYAYHQLNFLPLAAFGSVLLANRPQPNTNAESTSWRTGCALVCCFLPQLIAIPIMGSHKFLAHLDFHRFAKVPPAWSDSLIQIQNVMVGREALYATWGDAPYLLQTVPSQKYYSYLFFLEIKQNFEKNPEYIREFHNHWLEFDGPLIIASEPFRQLGRFPSVEERVKSEYEVFHEESCDRYPGFRRPVSYYFLRRKDGGPFEGLGAAIPFE